MTEAIRAEFEKIAYLTPEYIGFIRAHLEDARVYYTQLLGSITEANFEERFDLGVFPAYFAAAEYHWVEAYPDMVRILRIPVDMSDPGYFSDFLAVFMQTILYHVYNGDPQPLVDLIQDAPADQFARNAALCTLAELYTDGLISQPVLEGAARSFYTAQFQAQEALLSLPVIICALRLDNLAYLIDESVDAGLWDEAVFGPPDVYFDELEYDLDFEIGMRAWICLENGQGYMFRGNKPTRERERACFEAQRARLASYLPAGAQLPAREGP